MGRVFATAGTYQLWVGPEGGATRNYSITWESSRADLVQIRESVRAKIAGLAHRSVRLQAAPMFWSWCVAGGHKACLVCKNDGLYSVAEP
jgi:hypothetical protein